MIDSKIENLLVQLEPKFLAQVQAYLEYMICLQQQKHKPHFVNKGEVQKKLNKISILQRFKGDAPFPHVSVSKSDFYEQ